jgi:hypothetical protein
MKTARLLFAIVGFGAVTLVLGYAGEPSTQPPAQATYENHTTSDRRDDRAQGHEQHHAKPVAKNHKEFGGKRGDGARTERESANDHQQPGLKRAVTGAANDGWMMNKMENRREELARLPVGGGTPALAPGAVRGRSATAAVIGGLVASTAKNSAAVINGTGMNRRPY